MYDHDDDDSDSNEREIQIGVWGKQYIPFCLNLCIVFCFFS